MLDVFVFRDAAAAPVLAALQAGQAGWFATAAMREELARVLHYPKVAPRVAFHGHSADAVLALFDRHAVLVAAPAKAPVTCSDPDDQIFVDLAVDRRALLLSKDRAVLALRKRLARLDVATRSTFHPPPGPFPT